MELPFDVKCVIAGYFQEAWYAMYRMEAHDSEFRKYAESGAGIARFTKRFTVRTITPSTTYYTLLGKLHRVNKPAHIHDFNAPTITYSWFCNGLCHRDGDEPAMVYGVMKKWYSRGQLHRDGDRPAMTNDNGGQVWWWHGRIERPAGGPVVIIPDGREFFAADTHCWELEQYAYNAVDHP